MGRMVEYSPYRRKRSHIPEHLWQDALNRGVMREIDPEIRNLIFDLNQNRQYTSDCCAGHERTSSPSGLSGRGYVAFDARAMPEDATIRTIMTSYGLTGIRKERRPGTGILFTFDPIGEPGRNRRR